VVLGLLAVPALLIRVLVKRVIITLALVATRVAVMPAAMQLTTELSKNTLTKATRVKRRFLKAAVLWSACIGIGFAANGLSEEVAYAVEWPETRLEFEFVAENVESELACDLFEDCLHIEVLNTSQCKTNVSIELGLEGKFSRYLGDAEIIVPSPGYTGGFVIEIGSNTYDDIDTFGIYSVSCSSVLANVLAEG
jgi:hypothetical protein